MLVTVFSSIEDGIYTAIIASVAFLLLRIAHPRGRFLGKVTIHADRQDSEAREVYAPLSPDGHVLNPHLKVEPPTPGVIVYRFEEGYLYPNSSFANSSLVAYVKKNTRRGKDMSNVKASDRAWNDPGPRPGQIAEDDSSKPLLRAVVLDFSGVSHIDVTGIQALVDTRNEIERWTDAPVDFHFATILSPWIRRALIAGNFGIGSAISSPEVATVLPYGGRFKADTDGHEIQTVDVETPRFETYGQPSTAYGRNDEALVPVDTPFFHFDLRGAVLAAETGLSRQRSKISDSSRNSTSKGKEGM